MPIVNIDRSEAAKLPVLLVHGIGSRDKSTEESTLWGRIPAALQAQGHDVYFGNQDAWGTVESNAEQLRQTIDAVYDGRGIGGRIIMVAHSKGGLDALAACRCPSTSDKVAALITLSTPHSGMRFCDALMRSRLVIPHVAAPFVNLWAKGKGDACPDSYGALQCLGAADVEETDLPVKLISVGFASRQPQGLVAYAVSRSDGANDGLVPLISTKNGDWRVADAKVGTRFLHTDAIDASMRDIQLTMDGAHYGSIVDLVVDLVKSAAPA